MFPARIAIKTTAKQTLAEHWSQAIAIVFLFFGALIMPSLLIQFFDILSASAFSRNENIITAISAIYSIFVFYPLLLGILRWFWGITAAQNMPLSVLFLPFADSKEYRKSLKVIYAFGWRLALADLPRNLSLLLKPSFFYFIPAEVDIAALIGLFQGLCEFLSLGLSLLVFCRLLPLPFLVINHPCGKISDNVRESIYISKKTASQYLSLFLSMAGWIFLSFLIIPIIYTLPFFLASIAVMIRFSINYCISLNK